MGETHSVAALNIVDAASEYQMLIPFFSKETSALLRGLYRDNWKRPFGAAVRVKYDSGSTNIGLEM
eukprot:8520327-Alexandrium_andersonii.AAC.1